MRQSEPDENGMGESMVMITARDSTFYYHIVKPQQAFKGEKAYELTNVTKNNASKAAMWPYVAISGDQNNIWLICAFDLKIMKRINLPFLKKNSKIQQICITKNYELFVLIDHFRPPNIKYELLLIDLDNPHGFVDFEEQKFEIKSVFTYKPDEVEGKPVFDMIVRSGSTKANFDDQNYNQ